MERAAGSRTAAAGAVATVAELVPDPDAWEADNRQAIAARYRVVRPFVRLLAEQLPLGAAPTGTDLLIEVKGRLPGLLRRRVDQKPLTEADLNMTLVAPMWRRAVLNNPALDGAADRDAYVMCPLTQLHAALRRRDLFADPSLRWAGPRAKLLDGADWSAVRGEVLAGLGLTAPVEAHLGEYTATLDAGWRQLTQRIAEAGPDASVRVVPDGETGRMRHTPHHLVRIREALQGDPVLALRSPRTLTRARPQRLRRRLGQTIPRHRPRRVRRRLLQPGASSSATRARAFSNRPVNSATRANRSSYDGDGCCEADTAGQPTSLHRPDYLSSYSTAIPTP